jgi:protocatechuate 3,4-dioxygenase beta subunit
MRPLPILLAIVVVFACTAHAAPKEVLIGGPCDGCEYVFVDRPKSLASSTRIAAAKEPGERMTLEGVVRDAAGKPVAGIIVYAYHTNAAGLYPAAKTLHGALRGFALTDKKGTYRFDTIRPGSYPSSNNPQHIHMHVVEPGKCHYYIDDVVFTDDPLLTPAQRKAHEHGRGGVGVTTPKRDGKQWRVHRDITLGAGISDYDRCR